MTEAIRNLKAYRVISERRVKELNSDGMILEHIGTGARIFLLSNEDENKVFTIGFRTPPADSTGVAHITEHSVLCGSAKFPVKDPFVELVKGSLNTFLNAMTYPDKTVYPVASCNDQDFQNLMDVYMDAVFNPNIYREEKIFRQEGWHYELNSPEDPITINGVVYNEMKGAFSSPESVLDRCILNSLYPDTCYGVESGGDPKDIPDLTYEAFLDFHRRYYHPSNSFIYLYGNMDMAEKLEWLDREYLSAYGPLAIDSAVRLQKPAEVPVDKEICYSITEDEPEEHRTYLSLSMTAGEGLDANEYMAFQILQYILLEAPGALLKRELVGAGIGQDITGGYEGGIRQPYFSIIAKNTDPERKEEFLAIIRKTLADLAENGIREKTLLAGINAFEFRMREADFGNYPRGLMYGLQCFDSWLYDGDPVLYLAYEPVFEFLRKAAGEGYFEGLIRKYFLDNPFRAVITVLPKKNMTAGEDRLLREKLLAYKESLTPAELEKLAEETRALKAYQDEPSPKEDLEKIPMLTRDQIRKTAEPLVVEETKTAGITVLRHEYFANGIIYLRLLLNTNRIPGEDLPYASLLKTALAYMDTEWYTLAELSDEIDLSTGGVSADLVSLGIASAPGDFRGVMSVGLRVLPDKLAKGLELLSEVLLHTKLSDTGRLREIIDETKARQERRLTMASHAAAVTRAGAAFAPEKAFDERINGISWYDFLKELSDSFEEKKDEIVRKLRDTAARLFTTENMILSVTADGEGQRLVANALPGFVAQYPQGDGTVYPFEWERSVCREGVKTSSQVNYVARSGRFLAEDRPYTACLKLLKPILSYDYLWLNVRVKGGAYGVMTGSSRSGIGYFVSYRDPNMFETDEIFAGVADYLASFDADERTMTKYVIGTISDMDTPLTPQAKGSRADFAWIAGVTDEMLQRERTQVLTAQPEDIRALAPYMRAVMEEDSLVVIGNADRIEEERGAFTRVRNML